MSTLLFYRVVSLLAPLLSQRSAYAISRQLSGLAYRYNREIRQAVEANLRVVLEARGRACPQSGLDRIVRRNFDNFGKYLVDFFQIRKLTAETLSAKIRVENIEYLDQCRDLKMGIIGLTAHIGNWELGAGVLTMNGFQVNAIVQQQPFVRLNALFQSRRARRGVHALPMHGAASAAAACLKRNELVVLLADLDVSGRERLVPFFGKPARLPRGPAVLAVRSGAPILPAFVLRQADDTFCFRVYPPILPDRSRSIADTRKCICTLLEEVIGDHPDQWFAFEPRWVSAVAPGPAGRPRTAYPA